MNEQSDSADMSLLLYEQGTQLTDAGRDSDALVMFRESWEVGPHATTAYRIAMILRKQSDFANAIVWLEKAHQLNPRHGQIATEYAKALADRGDKVRARAILIDVLSRMPTYGPAGEALKVIQS